MRPEPVIVLGTPGPDPARLGAMLGGHPAGAFVPALRLGSATTPHALGVLEKRGSTPLTDGWRRAIAFHCFGGQDAEAIADADHWLFRREDRPLPGLAGELADRLAPAAMVTFDTDAVWRIVELERLLDALPDTRIIHLVHHPVPDCERMVDAQRQAWFIPSDYHDFGPGHDRAVLDPQLAWLRIHLTIRRACEALPPARYRRIDWHALARDPEPHLDALVDWLGWPAMESGTADMLRPERSPFCHPGPAEAPGGVDTGLYASPGFAPRLAPVADLSAPLSWRDDGVGFAPEVRTLAREFGLR
ncbi:sulfotransferase [Algiphilus sp.]|uniref:sulfotransferase n=1 Tax=Algiphilus sp. TaxID=1872431 RepID=UPI0025BF71ED|nr:sulfotransferase [Algiphilus sp.]MCK5770177.1 sulfotransferase [Algiphilus sp.]